MPTHAGSRLTQLSLIIPTHNRAALLQQTLRSVMGQTRMPDEIVVVDDGSTDETRQVVRRFGARVRYIYQERGFVPAARNRGMSIAGGDLLSFLDSDDLLLPRALETLEGALRADPGAALAYCRSQTIDARGTVIEPRWGQADHAGNVWQPLLNANFIRTPGCAMIRRSHLERVEEWDTRLPGVEDWDLWLRLAEAATFVRVEEPLLQYRVHATSLSANRFAMHCAMLRLYRKHQARHGKDPATRRQIEAVRTSARLGLAQRCVQNAIQARTDGEEAWAMLHLFRAARLRPGYLLEPSFLRRVLGTGRSLGRRLRFIPSAPPA